MEQSIAKKEKHVKFNLTVEEKTIIKDKNKALDIYEPQNQKIKQKSKNKHKLNKKKQNKFNEEKKQKNISEKPFNNKIKNKNNNQHKLKESKRNFDIKIDTKNLTDIEKTIIKDGTFIDKLNLVTLLILRNNDNDLLTILLDKIPSFRNDDKFYALKNVKDLLKEEFVLTTVNKLKFKRIFESETKNNFIKEKMLNLLKELIKKQILINDLLYILVNKLGDKKEIHKNIFSFLEEIYNENKKIVIKELILFYDKCSILRGKINVAKFFALHCKNEDLTNFYSSFDDLEYKKETEVVQLYYYFLLGMKERVLNISFRKLKCCLKNEKLILLSLYAIKNNFKEKLNSVLLTVINFNYKVNGYDLLNFIYESVEEKKEIIDALFKSANIIDINFLCGIIMLAKASNEKIGKMSDLLKIHYHPLVRNISCDKNTELMDPYNEIEFKKKVYDSFKYL